MSTTPQVTMRATTELTEPRPDLTTASLNFRNPTLVKTKDNVEGVGAKSDAIMKDRSLSDMGAAVKLANLATASASMFTYLKNLAADQQAAKAQMRTTLFSIVSPVKDPLVRELREQEARTNHQDLAPHELIVAFTKAAEEDQLEILSALLNGPMGPMIDDDIKDRALTDRAKRLQPELFHAYEQLTLLQEWLDSWRAHISRWLLDLGGDPQTVAEALGLPFTPPTGYQPPQTKGTEWAKKILSNVA